MKRVIAFSVSVVISFALGIFVARSPHVHAGGAGPVASQNGDVNGDGELNLSDAVYLLNSLFRGGPQPVSCPDGAHSSGLPDTGQTKCYDASGAEIPCDGATCHGQDGFYETGCPSEGRFTDNGDGTVTDNCTGLMWQKDPADVNGDGRSTDQDFITWCDALAYCEGLSFAGHDDWRLPNVRELQSIVDYGRVSPSIDPVFGALRYDHWSSTSTPGAAHAWLVNFGVGRVDVVSGENVNSYVRAVRPGP